MLHARRQGWERPQPGFVLLPGTQRTFEARVAAALLQVGGRVLAGRRTSGYLLGMVDRRLLRLEGVDRQRSLMIDARQRRAVRFEEIAAIHERIGRTPGGGRLTQVLAELEEECCSDGITIEIGCGLPVPVGGLRV